MAGYRGKLLGAMVTFIVVDGIALAARVYVRARMLGQNAFGLDDFFLCLTYTGFVISCAMGFTSMAYGFAADDKQLYYDKARETQFYYANQLAIYISSGLVKLAVALVLLRIARTKRMRWLLLASMVIVALWTIVMTLFSSWLCATKGSSNYAGSATCSSMGYFRTSTNIVIDYFYALLPVYMLWDVQMNFKMKASVLLLLGLGAFASSATIVKLVVIIKLVHATAAEAVDLHYDLLLWADIELGLAILAVSAAALRPILKYVHVPWTYGSKSSPSQDGIYHELEHR
ncbi:hypothetical protein PG999_005233 [Apiospora kogelbergensis]|uniref:Rhodopsin domain-containing protein n=1 Tax=Apiospora kogelbergensis TaxID=1337665 RepID=A0AAW0R1M2_9PEZI